MSRLILARALGIFLGFLALAMLWNGIDALRYSKAPLEFVIMVLQMLSAFPLALAAYWLWKRDRRSVLPITVGMGMCTVVGTMAASYWTEPAERWSAGLGALGASVVLLIIVVLLARSALKAPPGEPSSVPSPSS